MTWIKKLYLYLVSLISLVIIVIGSIMLLNMALKAWVFTKADQAYYYDPGIECAQRTPMPEGQSSSVEMDKYCTEEAIEKRRQQDADRRAGDKQREASNAIAMILVASPVFYYHWRMARKEV